MHTTRWTAAWAVPVVVLCLTPALQFRHWSWVALVLAAPVVVVLGAPVHRAAWAALRRGDVGADVLASAAPLAALGWSVHMLLVGGAGLPGFTQSISGPRPVALDAAVVLVLLALPCVGRSEPSRAATVWTALVLGLGVAVLGFGLGSGDAAAPARATAVLVAGAPAAWLSAAPLVRRAARVARPGPRTTGTPPRRVDTVVVTEPATLFTGDLAVRAVHAVDGADVAEIRRLAAALHVDHVPHPLAAAIVADTGPLPGVSDPDGAPDTGLRGVTSELRDDLVVAHAVLAGPPGWLRAHGVEPTAEGGLCVAWDGVVRGRLDVDDVLRPEADAACERLRRRGVTVLRPRPDISGLVRRLRERGHVVALVGTSGQADLLIEPSGTGLPAVADAVRRSHRTVSARRGARGVAAVAAAVGTVLAATGALDPATAAVVPLGATALVTVCAGALLPWTGPRRGHPMGDTPG